MDSRSPSYVAVNRANACCPVLPALPAYSQLGALVCCYDWICAEGTSGVSLAIDRHSIRRAAVERHKYTATRFDGGMATEYSAVFMPGMALATTADRRQNLDSWLAANSLVEEPLPFFPSSFILWS